MNFNPEADYEEEQLEKIDVIYLAVRRLFEMLICSVFLSAFGIFLNFSGIAGSQKMLMVSLFLGTLVFLFLNLHQLKQCYFDLRDKKAYYLVNLGACLSFVIISLVVYALGGNTAFAWCFAISKFLRYTNWEISTLVSALVFYILMFGAVLVAPLGMGWIFLEEEEEDDLYG